MERTEPLIQATAQMNPENMLLREEDRYKRTETVEQFTRKVQMRESHTDREGAWGGVRGVTRQELLFQVWKVFIIGHNEGCRPLNMLKTAESYTVNR